MFTNKIGLALGGGGARGLAHVGVLRCVEDHKFKIATIAGTSVGAFVGALYAFGKSSYEIERIMRSLSFGRLASFAPGSLGMLRNGGVRKVIYEALGDVRLEDSRIPLAIVCTDLVSGRKVVFTEGPVATLVQASSCFPGILSPIEYQGMVLVDGALTENVPVQAAEQLGATFTIAVSLAEHEQGRMTPRGMFDVISRSFDILVDHAAADKVKEAHYHIQLNVGFMGRFKIEQPERAIAVGYEGFRTMLSRPLLYWWIKPIFDHIYRLFYALYRALAHAVQNPIHIPIPVIAQRLRKIFRIPN